MELNNHFATNVKHLRTINKMSQEQLGTVLGKDYSTIGKWELGQRSPSMEDTLNVCKVFDTDLNDLLTKDLRFVDNEVEKQLQDKILDNVKLCTEDEKRQILQIIEVIRKNNK